MAMEFVNDEVLHNAHINAIIKGIGGVGVVSGCEVTEAPAAKKLKVAAGVIRIAGGTLPVSAGTVTVTDNTSGYPRKDIVIVGGGGTFDTEEGTPASPVPYDKKGKYTESPSPPSIPANSVLLAEVWVPNGFTDIDSTRSQAESHGVDHGWVIDRRIIVRP